MARRIRFLLCIAMAGAVSGQQDPTAMPAWLSHYPGAEVTVTNSPGLVQATYRSAARRAEVVAHYQRQLDAAGLKPLVSDDGMGTSIRTSAPQCDLLILIREQDQETLARVSCAAPSQPSTAAPQYRQVPSVRPSAGGYPRADAPRTGRSTDMTKYDQPYYGARRPYQPSAALAPSWPSWLCHMPGADRPLNIVEGVNQSKRNFLRSKFVTNAPMTAIHEFYENLLKSNGFNVYRTRLSTGQTHSGVVQNRSGSIEGSYSPNGIRGGRTEVEVYFSRTHLNAPISVSLTVTAIPPW